jgi:RNA polymerase sigma-70 factor (ECF subfamily)
LTKTPQEAVPEVSGTAREVERVARLSYGRLVAILAARTRHLPDAEDLLGEALVQALAVWPVRGLPENPEAWLLNVARRRYLDSRRVQGTADRLRGHVALLEEERLARRQESRADDRLAFLFACAHPGVDPGVRTALMLQVVLGVDVVRMAGAFLMLPAAQG